MLPRDLMSWKPGRSEKEAAGTARKERANAERLARTGETQPPQPPLGGIESLEDFFKSFFREFRLEPTGHSGIERREPSAARVRLTEDDKEFRLTVELPGMTEADIEVKLTDDRLILGGNREDETRPRDQHSPQRAYKSFYRSLTLPHGIAKDDVRAELKAGVLTLRMPRTEEARKTRRQSESAGG